MSRVVLFPLHSFHYKSITHHTSCRMEKCSFLLIIMNSLPLTVVNFIEVQYFPFVKLWWFFIKSLIFYFVLRFNFMEYIYESRSLSLWNKTGEIKSQFSASTAYYKLIIILLTKRNGQQSSSKFFLIGVNPI